MYFWIILGQSVNWDLFDVSQISQVDCMVISLLYQLRDNVFDLDVIVKSLLICYPLSIYNNWMICEATPYQENPKLPWILLSLQVPRK